MKKEVTVDKAIKKYIQIICAGIITTLIAFFVAAFYTSTYFSDGIDVIISFIVSISVFMLIFPAFNIWKYWAFSRVRNVHELKKRLISLRFISEKSKFFKRIENCTEDDKKYWKLRLKFEQEDIFVDDETIPDETIVYYSKSKSIAFMVISIFLFAFGILLLLIPDDSKKSTITVLGLAFSILAVIGFCKEYMKLRKREPQLILNNKGIKTIKAGFHKWEEIEKYEIVSSASTNSAFFRYKHSRGEESIEISSFDINNTRTLSKLLIVYENRSKLQNSRKQ